MFKSPWLSIWTTEQIQIEKEVQYWFQIKGDTASDSTTLLLLLLLFAWILTLTIYLLLNLSKLEKVEEKHVEMQEAKQILRHRLNWKSMYVGKMSTLFKI